MREIKDKRLNGSGMINSSNLYDWKYSIMQWKDFLQCSFTNTTIYVPNVFISIKFESYLTYII